MVYPNLNPDGRAEVSFMDQVPEKNNFRWRSGDNDEKFVFMWNVKTTGQNGHSMSMSVEDYKKLVLL